MGLVAATIVSTALVAEPEPEGKNRRGFQLFARALGAITINRVYCGMTSDGNICVDSLGSATIGGGFWPKGTADQYVFATGLQLAGIIGADGGPWANDTTGAFFFDPKGTTLHGLEVRPIFNSVNPDDFNNWPEAAIVPCATGTPTPQCTGNPGAQNDPVGDIYSPLLQGRTIASQGDIWFLSWDGDPGLLAGRPHPLGVLAETRGLGWNFPSGNEDIIYFVYTFYNVTSTNPSAYTGSRTSMGSILLQQGQQFHALNNAAFGVTLPTDGYTIDPLFAAFGTDMDVAQAGVNYASVNLPFALGDTYDHTFGQSAGWTFDPTIFSPPFFAGSGFVGVKYLRSPTGPGEIQLYSNTENGGPFGDAQNTTQLYRYLSGQISTAAGDAPCNTGDPTVTRICYLNNTRPFDMRFFQSSTPLSLGPGEFGSIVVAYIFAAPVSDPSCAPPCDILPGDATIMGDAVRMAAGVPDQQRLAGYLGFNDVNGDLIVTQDEFVVVPGSLLGKALTAQAVFDAKFLLPFAPDAPDFFLIPGDNKVTVMWQATTSEATGDPYFQVARDAQISGAVNPLYDPNYREFDVEGYRVYRGRVDAPNELTLIGQFDYSGTSINDYGAQVNPTPLCAPELGLDDNNPNANCPAAYDQADFVPGTQRTVFVSVGLDQLDATGSATNVLDQVKLGERTLLGDGTAIVLISDTAVVGLGGSCAPNPCPPLQDTGVPFVLEDTQVRNNFRYFYSVTAFDVNSWQSGPTNLESPRITKAVVPTVLATNYDNTATVTQGIYGRDVLLDHTGPEPTLDAATGKFSGPFPASNAWTIGLSGFVSQVLSGSGALAVRLDSLQLGSPYNSPAVPHRYWYTASSAGQLTPPFSIPITQPAEIGLRTGAATLPPVFIDGSLAARYGGDGTYSIPGAMSIAMEGPDYHALYGRGCVNSRDGFANSGSRNCAYNGSRWFDGPSPANNEVMDNPIGANVTNFSGDPMADFNNAGMLTGLSLLHNTQAYQSVGGAEYRPMEGIRSGARRAADFNVYWGAGGTIDSIIDITHNVPVPFASDKLAGTWGILNQSAALPNAGSFDARDELTSTDLHCIEPVRSFNSGTAGCNGGPVYALSQTAIPGPVVPYSTGLAASQTAPVWADAGFGLYLSGDFFTIALAGGGVPADGTVWALRTYIGAISGGTGAGGDYGPYIYNVFPGGTVVPRSWTAVGSEIRVSFTVNQAVTGATQDDLANVHPVPDPYYVTNEFETEPTTSFIEFINLPQQAIIRIYSSSGVLVDLIEHNSSQFGGSATWGVRNRNNQVVASGVYFYHVESGDARRVGRMTIVRFAQ